MFMFHKAGDELGIRNIQFGLDSGVPKNQEIMQAIGMRVLLELGDRKDSGGEL